MTKVLSWIGRNKRLSAFGLGVALYFACPYLPQPLQGPCRLVAVSLRRGDFDGLPIPGLFDSPDAG